MGRRTVKKVEQGYSGGNYGSSNITTYVYDGWNIIREERSPDSQGRRETIDYVWGLDLSGSIHGAGGVGGLISMTRTLGTSTNSYYYCMDGNGNVMNLVDAVNGSVAATYTYSPFGQTLQATGPMAKENPFRFSTKYFDDETGLGYWGYRYYHPEEGRWVSRDPIQERGGLNLFAANANDPINRVDLFGLMNISQIVSPNVMDTKQFLTWKTSKAPPGYKIYAYTWPQNVVKVSSVANGCNCDFSIVANVSYTKVVPSDSPYKNWLDVHEDAHISMMKVAVEKLAKVCGRSAADDPGVRLEVDHIKPVSSWGLTVEKNLWAVCKECNRGKSDRRLDHVK